ncbi:MAG: MOSC domain-containing protein [Pseudomonadota bacterium]
MSEQIIGRVAELWRYPVQSMRGEAMSDVTIWPNGMPGDRAWGVLDPAEGKIAAAAKGKKPWRELIRWQAHFLREPEKTDPTAPVEIRLPDGELIDGTAPDRDHRIAAAIGAPAKLVARHIGNQAYGYASLHLLTTATLKALSAHYPSGRFEPARFRPNIVIDSGALESFVEQGWIDARVLIGEAALEVADHCLRCVLTTLPQGLLPLDPGILKATSEANERRAGVYAAVAKTGRIRVGDPVRLTRTVSRSAA